MNVFEAIIIAIVEGITRYLPVSSTGRMLITSGLLGIHEDEFTKLCEVAIQLGAIMAVVVLYWKKFFDFSRWQFYVKLIIAVIPALVFGKLFSDAIDAMLEVTTVAISLLLGGIILLFIDKLFTPILLNGKKRSVYKKAFFIGVWQCLAMIPGVFVKCFINYWWHAAVSHANLPLSFRFISLCLPCCAATGYKLLQEL